MIYCVIYEPFSICDYWTGWICEHPQAFKEYVYDVIAETGSMAGIGGPAHHFPSEDDDIA